MNEMGISDLFPQIPIVRPGETSYTPRREEPASPLVRLRRRSVSSQGDYSPIPIVRQSELTRARFR